MQRAAPWGPVPSSGMPVTLTPTERAAYEAEWGEFCREMDIARRGRNAAKGRAALLRFRQKAGLIRVDSTVAWIAQRSEEHTSELQSRGHLVRRLPPEEKKKVR